MSYLKFVDPRTGENLGSTHEEAFYGTESGLDSFRYQPFEPDEIQKKHIEEWFEFKKTLTPLNYEETFEKLRTFCWSRGYRSLSHLLFGLEY